MFEQSSGSGYDMCGRRCVDPRHRDGHCERLLRLSDAFGHIVVTDLTGALNDLRLSFVTTFIGLKMAELTASAIQQKLKNTARIETHVLLVTCFLVAVPTGLAEYRLSFRAPSSRFFYFHTSFIQLSGVDRTTRCW